MRQLEIAITYLCNVSCNNCSSLSPQAPTRRTDDMAEEDVQRFINESVACNYPWRHIKLYGGQPTIHPAFLRICVRLAGYRNWHNQQVRLSVVSNGSDHEKVAAAVGMGFDPLVSPKVKGNTDASGSKLPYVPCHVSPKDLGRAPSSGCYIPPTCGVALNNLGFWPCSPAAAAARVFGYTAPVIRVADLTAERLMALYCHCDHCGFAIEQPRSYEQVTSPTWQQKLDTYRAAH